ncbi:Uma2 family endonuclease [Tautonia marina]|uniref:Uma2 family endonuclease n=1 Tax=Tautonia marina TaxID=2653855 RepID=UPI001260C105|nr:Uma2 family endonuclease [Tautonia marina]
MATAVASLITAEQFGNRPDPGFPEELVRGRVVRMPPPNRRHGQVCGQAYFLIRHHVDAHDLGHVLSNDSGVITERNPDTVRGADIAFYSYQRLPKGPLPQSYGPEVPELIVEVRSPGDRWPDVLAKVTEYLNAGVVAVLVLDPEARSAQVYRVDHAPQMLQDDDELTLPDLLGDFRVAVRCFFD